MALFTFVARDPLSQKAVAVNQLRPSSEADGALFAERQRVADERRTARRAAAEGTTTPSARPHIPEENDASTCGRIAAGQNVSGVCMVAAVMHALIDMALCSLVIAMVKHSCGDLA